MTALVALVLHGTCEYQLVDACSWQDSARVQRRPGCKRTCASHRFVNYTWFGMLHA